MHAPIHNDIAMRARLLAEVDRLADLIAETASESEERRALSPRALAALKDAGLLRMRVPVEAGGLGVTPVTIMQALAALAAIDVATAWNVMVMNNSAGFIASFLPEPGFNEVWANGVPNCAGVAPPYGEAVPCEGGWRVTGRFRLCSGVPQAEWLRLSTMTQEAPSRRLFIIVPKSAVTVLDNWSVVALSGTGSNDVALDDCFVPQHMTFYEEKCLRGGPQHRQRGLTASSYEHTGIALGIARRALREAAGVLTKRRIEARLNRLGRLQVQLDAITALVTERLERDFAALADPSIDADKIGTANLAMSAHATDVAQECVEFAYRIAGAAALYRPSVFERLLRDVHGATQHIGVHDGHYTDLGGRIVDGERAA